MNSQPGARPCWIVESGAERAEIKFETKMVREYRLSTGLSMVKVDERCLV